MGQTKDYRVMIIDDDDSMLTIMKSQVGLLYEVVTASSGAEAFIKLADPILPNLILLDIMMPQMDGYEVLKRLKADERLKKIPVVFLTGMTDESHEYRGLQLEVIDYLKKPVASRILLARIQHYIELHSNISNRQTIDRAKLEALPEKLTDREMEVVELMAEFRSDREISEILKLSIPYVKKLVGTVKEKLGLEKRGDIRRYM
ncbi:MAG: response regulator [Lachnospiraceae bacterium]|nr:response regulator [Lachnospiraceae bacterium]